MSNSRIKGITIELNGDTTGLTDALKDVNKESNKVSSELKAVERGLKFDPGSTELIAQKQQHLSEQIQNTSKKLDVLKTAQSQVEEQFRNGDIGEDQYRAFNRELAITEAQLKSYDTKLSSVVADQTKLSSSTSELKTFFSATGTEVDKFTDVLGSRLTNAIREGTASADQIGKALEIMGKKALGSSADIDRMRNSLRNADAGASLKTIQKDLASIAKDADKAGDSVNGFGDKLKGVAAGLVAGGGLAATIHEALEVSSLNTDIEISMGIKGGDIEAVRSSINTVTAAIGDEEAAYEGVRRQLTLNKNASIESNNEIIKSAAMISRAYKEVDFKELIQESHEIGKELGITQKEALGLTNQLLSLGFPTEQLDIISEYGSQLKTAGFSAEQVQAIMAAGVETGTWNIDILLDGLKEGRIKAAEFGQGVDKAMKEALEGTKISAAQVEKWGQAVAKGGDEGQKALVEMNTALMGIKDETKRNEIGVKLYGTLWEEQGTKISATLQNMDKHMKTTGEMTGKLKEDTSKLEADPAYRLAEAMNKIKESLAPVLADLAEMVASIADWVAENPKLTATIVGVVAVLGTLIGAFAALMPAIGSFVGLVGGGSAAVGILGSALAVLTGPVGLTIAAVAALGVSIYAVTKELGNSSIEVESWKDKVSEGTAKAVGSYLDLEQKATNAFHQIAWSGETVTQEMATKMVGMYDQMGQQVLTEMQTDHAAQLAEQQKFFADSNALSTTEEAQILERLKQSQAAEEVATQEGNTRIKEIWQTAANEKRAITEDEAAQIDLINAQMKENAVKHLSESERDQKLILENLKTESTEITATQAAEVVKNSKKQKDESTKEAEDQYNKTVKNAQMQRDELGIISQEQYQKIVDEAEKTRNDTVKKAQDMHQNVVKEAQSQAGEHVKQVDWETGEVKSKFAVMKEDTVKAIKDIGEGISKGWNTTWTSTKKFVTDIGTSVSKGFGDMVTSVAKEMGEVRTTIEKKWKEAESFLKGVKLGQIGKDIVNGLIQGIGDMFGGVKRKVEELAGFIPEWAKDILGIHSPSRVMKQIGLWTGEGLVIGLDQSSPKVNKSMENIGNGILDVSKAYQEEYSNLIDEFNRKNEDKNDKTLEKIYKIQNNAAKKKRALTKQESQEIALLEASYRDQKMQAEINFQKKYKALVEKSEKEYLEVIKNFIADKKSLDELSLMEEAAIWEQSIEMFVEGSRERILAQKEYQKAVDAVNKEVLAINKDYQSQMQKINDDLIKAEKDLNKAYDDEFAKREAKYKNFAGTFEAFKVELNRTGQELLDNLQGQVDGFKKWQDEFAKLSGRNIDDGLLKELSDLGVKALPELVALNSMTDEQLTQYSALYQEKAALARQQAEKELVGMKEDTDKQILALREVASKQLDKLKTEWSLKIKELTSTTASELSSLQQIGIDAGQGLLNGLASMEGPLISKAQQIANAISSTIQQALDIHSPSRVMKGFGVNIGQGLIVGMDEMINKVSQSSQRLSNAVSNVHGSIASSRAKSQGNANSISSSTTTIDNRKNFNPTVNVYTMESPEKAMNRELKRMAFLF
ncbi:hypothetical protein B1B04_24325 [Lysinibacillus sp. KCTC 33748]|uniref:hypothetical protein n=1 Tax=unclassified Lysinibacillus TaxID=2636778 RepID=UPI0009A8AD6B|nr:MULTISPECIES: hypothetical protein [unclassified Lysinibacillus]OXS66077.1 hypothetical protein B1B04_24325 [Lysinibacillus sp. KCTC 33748]SKC18362.1 Phage-related minor tail protein [Lysinibacillus sp. AC-3]